MNDEQRDELLIRIDERVRDIKEEELPEIKKGLNNHAKRIRIIELVLAGSGILGGGAFGIIKLLSG